MAKSSGTTRTVGNNMKGSNSIESVIHNVHFSIDGSKYRLDTKYGSGEIVTKESIFGKALYETTTFDKNGNKIGLTGSFDSLEKAKDSIKKKILSGGL